MEAVAVADVCKILNLENSGKIADLFGEHEDLVLAQIDKWVNSESTSPLLTYAYSYLILANTIEFINLKTLGEGIIKTTGMAEEAQALLDVHEIDIMRKRFEIKALEAVQDDLTSAGITRLRMLKFGKDDDPMKGDRCRGCIV